MFLASLGARSDGIVMEFVKSKSKLQEGGVFDTQDKRGRKKVDNNPLHEKIVEHINMFNPAVSYYNREKAPNRRYLEGHLTIKGTSIFYFAYILIFKIFLYFFNFFSNV